MPSRSHRVRQPLHAHTSGQRLLNACEKSLRPSGGHEHLARVAPGGGNLVCEVLEACLHARAAAIRGEGDDQRRNCPRDLPRRDLEVGGACGCVCHSSRAVSDSIAKEQGDPRTSHRTEPAEQ
eukprot:scaffold31947_cov63-Phaeocystis_antarctica.AAC.1